MNFLLFAGDAYYPKGGWNDLKGAYETLDEAQVAMLLINEKIDWAHIVDLKTNTIVAVNF